LLFLELDKTHNLTLNEGILMRNLKNLVLSALAVLVLVVSSPAAIAADFNNTELQTTVTSGNMEFSIVADTVNGFSKMRTGIYVLDHQLGDVNAVVFASIGYNRMANTMSLRAEYQMSYDVDSLTLYGAVALDYRALTASLSKGDVFVEPRVGAVYAFTERVSVFGEAGYEWNASQNWGRNGGYVELGTNLRVLDNMTFTPSIVRYVDTRADSTQLRLGVGFAF